MRAIKHWIKNTVEEKLAHSSIKILNEELISNLTKIEINKVKEIRDKYVN